MALTDKQTIFVNEYLISFNRTQAALAAGYSKKTAYSIGAALLKNPEIAEAVSQRLTEAAMSADEVLMRLAEQARGAHGKYLSAFGVDLGQLIADNKGHLVKSIKQNQYGKDIEFYDAQAALVHLGRHHKLFTDKTEVSGELEIKDADAITDRLTSRLDSLSARISPPADTRGVSDQ